MKKIRSLSILILVATFMTACGGLKKMQKNAGLVSYDVKPEVLEVHGCADCAKQVAESRPAESRMVGLGMVPVTITGSYPERYFDRKATLTLAPVIKYAGGEVPYDKVQIVQGENVQANNRVISYSGGNFTYNSSIPYIETESRTGTPLSMKQSQLILKITAERKGKMIEFEPIKLADGVIATSTLVERYGSSIIMPDKFQRIIPETGVAEIPYVINRSDLQSRTLRADDILALRQYISDVNEDPNREFKTTVVSSYASPDGALSLNERISTSRGRTADRFIKNEFKAIEDAKSANFFDEKITAEDWDGFRTEVEKSNIRDKDLILRVLSMYSDPDVREKEIKNMSAAYEALKTDILPVLRRSRMVVNVDKIGRSDEQILAAMRNEASVLNIEEMLYAATLTNDLNEKLSFYLTAAEAFPTCIRAQNNIGCTYLAIAKAGIPLAAPSGGGRAPNPINAAIAAFERAKAMENNDVVKNNLGMAALAQGDIIKAEEYFTSMTAATVESRFGLGIVAIMKGSYDQAVNYFGSEPSFNNALVLILKGDYTRAKTMLDGIQELSQGKKDYLKAVVGARLDDRTYLLNGLRAAVAADEKWKDYARTDLEFRKYFNDGDFTSIIR